MKKTIIFILTIITLISVFSVTAFAEKSGEFSSDETIPTIGATVESADDNAENNDEAVGEVQLAFTTDNMSKTLEHMGLGMLGVIIVLSLIASVVLVLNKVFKA